MRVLLIALLLSTTAAFARMGRPGLDAPGPELNWTFGVHWSQPSFSSNVQGSRDGRGSFVDTGSDLGLQREGRPSGVLLEYKMGDHGFRVAYDTYRFGGEQALPRDIYLDGNLYTSGSVVQSAAKVKVFEGLYTYKFVHQPDAWVGLDLGAQFLKADLSATNLSTMSPSQTATPSLTMPQIGISGGSSGANGLLESSMFLHYFIHSGATWFRYGLDGRAYLYPHFGLRAFYEGNNIRIPAGSIQGDLAIHADAKVYGLGLVARF